MKLMQICLILCMISSSMLVAMQRLSLADMQSDDYVVNSAKTQHGMQVQKRETSFSLKDTRKLVAYVSYIVFDCELSKNKEWDIQKIIEILSASQKYIAPSRTLEWEPVLSCEMALEEAYFNTKAWCMKKRKHGDIVHGFKTYIMPSMKDSLYRVIFASHLIIQKEYQVQGLGKQIMRHLFSDVHARYPASMLFWIVHPFSKSSENTMTQCDLEKFYKNCGCTVTQDGSSFCYVDMKTYNFELLGQQSNVLQNSMVRSRL
jgi:hypothetical protein